jgi:hypothetical protein
VGWDCVLEKLLIDRTFDWEEASVVNMAKEYAMQHWSAIGFCLLACIEDVVCCVCVSGPLCPSSTERLSIVQVSPLGTQRWL